MGDIVIAGGGPAGLAAAIALAERNVGATVIDAQGGRSFQRGELLAHGAHDIMQRLGLSNVLKNATRIKDVASRWGAARHLAHEGVPGLGFHGWGVDRQVLANTMCQRALRLGAKIVTARITSTKRAGSGWEVHATRQDQSLVFHPAYLIDATGRPALVARKHGAERLHAHPLVALLWEDPDGGTSSTMQAEAAKDGWWYACPHSKGRTVSFVTSPARAKEIQRAPERFVQTATQGMTLVQPPPHSAPERLMDGRSAVLDTLSGLRWLATGDAAAAFDPIASQGLHNALSGGFFAGNAVADALDGQADAPRVYQALAARTAARTHSLTLLQYAAMPYATTFWQERAG